MTRIKRYIRNRHSLLAEWYDAWHDYRELQQLSPKAFRLYRSLVPMAYIKGSVEWLDMKIACRHPILIPRADTAAWLQQVKLQPCSKILEVGTGTGCIAKYLAVQGHDVIAIDLNPKAVSLAKWNCRKLKNATIKEANLFEPVTGSFDWIISNPPYIPKEHWYRGWIGPSVRRWESKLALTPDSVGQIYGRLFQIALETGAKGLIVETDGTCSAYAFLKKLGQEYRFEVEERLSDGMRIRAIKFLFRPEQEGQVGQQ